MAWAGGWLRAAPGGRARRKCGPQAAWEAVPGTTRWRINPAFLAEYPFLDFSSRKIRALPATFFPDAYAWHYALACCVMTMTLPVCDGCWKSRVCIVIPISPACLASAYACGSLVLPWNEHPSSMHVSGSFLKRKGCLASILEGRFPGGARLDQG